MKRQTITILLGFLLFVTPVLGQQTVGLFKYDTTIADGYTLFAPTGNLTTYLINNCGHQVNSWSSNYPPGLSCYLSKDGYMYRSGSIPSNFSNAGGFGGIIEKYDWDGRLVWQYRMVSDSMTQHHDFRIMPNGNLLVLCWVILPKDQAIDLGRDPQLIKEDFIWDEVIYELKPKGTDEAEIVWEWRASQHVVQDKFFNKKNYGVIAEHPELFDFNSSLIEDYTDWLHLNSIDYNEELDQILLSGRTFSELYIIDHSTSSEEASGHFGGAKNNGGDLLYRWGNPMAYGRGNASNQKSFHQHDATWIPKGYPDAGKIMFFNNGGSRKYSSVEMFSPPYNVTTGHYVLEGSKAYLPLNASSMYQADNQADFYSANMGGAHRLKTGNTIICESTKGRILEVDKTKTVLWEYVSPVTFTIYEQGSVPVGNGIFKVHKYPSDFSGFNGKQLTDGKPIELKPLLIHCDDTTGQLVEDTTSVSVDMIALGEFTIFPNPASKMITVKHQNGADFSCSLYSASGIAVFENKVVSGDAILSIESLSSGIYYLRMIDPVSGLVVNQKLVKN